MTKLAERMSVIDKKNALAEAELQMRLLLDAAMRYREGEKHPEDLSDEERALLKSCHIRDTEVWMGNVSHYGVVEDALWGYFTRIGEDVMELLDGDEAAYNAMIERLCDRGPGGGYRRFLFIERP